MDPADSKIWNVCCIFYQIFSVSIQHDLCHFTVSQFPAMTGPCRSRAVFFWRAGLGFMSRPEKCRNGESWCWKCWMWSELERERGDVGKVEMKRVDLPGAVHLTTTAPSPSAPLPLIILISSFWQFLTVLAEIKKTWRGCFENSHALSPWRHWPWRRWLGKTLFCSLAEVRSYVWIVTKSVAITSDPGMISRRSGPGPGPHLGSTLARVKY